MKTYTTYELWYSPESNISVVYTNQTNKINILKDKMQIEQMKYDFYINFEEK